MARWENEDVSGLNLPDPEVTKRKFYGSKGSETEEKNSFAMLSDVGKSHSH